MAKVKSVPGASERRHLYVCLHEMAYLPHPPTPPPPLPTPTPPPSILPPPGNPKREWQNLLPWTPSHDWASSGSVVWWGWGARVLETWDTIFKKVLYPCQYLKLITKSSKASFATCQDPKTGKINKYNCQRYILLYHWLFPNYIYIIFVCTGRVPDPTSLFLPTSFCM